MHKIKLNQIKKIIIARTDVIGDMVLSLPVFKAIKEAYPHIIIDVYCRELTKPLLLNNPYINAVIIEESRNLKVEAKKLKGYDLFISLWEDPYYALLSLTAKIPIRVGYRTNLASILFYTHTKPFPWRNNLLHQIDYNLGLLSLLGIECSKNDYVPEIFGIKQYTENKIVIAIGARGANKLWKPEYFMEVIDYLVTNYTFNIELIGGPEESGISDFFKNKIINKRVVINIGNLNLSQTIQTIANAKYYLGADSGPMHIAAALGIPLVCLFITKNQKPTRWGPWNTRHLLLKARYACPDICRSSSCTKDLCTKAITIQDVINSLEEIIKGKGKINDPEYWQQKAFEILLIADKNDTEYYKNLLDYNVTIVYNPVSVFTLKKIIQNKNINIIHVLNGNHKILWRFFRIWLSNFLPTYPLLVFGKNTNPLELYNKGFEKLS